MFETHFRPCTAWKESKYGVTSGSYFSLFGPKVTPYLDTFHPVLETRDLHSSYSLREFGYEFTTNNNFFSCKQELLL